jgi:hypothetical protein
MIQHNCSCTEHWRAKAKQDKFYLIMHEHLFVFRKPKNAEDMTKIRYSTNLSAQKPRSKKSLLLVLSLLKELRQPAPDFSRSVAKILDGCLLAFLSGIHRPIFLYVFCAFLWPTPNFNQMRRGGENLSNIFKRFYTIFKRFISIFKRFYTIFKRFRTFLTRTCAFGATPNYPSRLS